MNRQGSSTRSLIDPRSWLCRACPVSLLRARLYGLCPCDIQIPIGSMERVWTCKCEAAPNEGQQAAHLCECVADGQLDCRVVCMVPADGDGVILHAGRGGRAVVVLCRRQAASGRPDAERQGSQAGTPRRCWLGLSVALSCTKRTTHAWETARQRACTRLTESIDLDLQPGWE